MPTPFGLGCFRFEDGLHLVARGAEAAPVVTDVERGASVTLKPAVDTTVLPGLAFSYIRAMSGPATPGLFVGDLPLPADAASARLRVVVGDKVYPDLKASWPAGCVPTPEEAGERPEERERHRRPRKPRRTGRVH